MTKTIDDLFTGRYHYLGNEHDKVIVFKSDSVLNRPGFHIQIQQVKDCSSWQPSNNNQTTLTSRDMQLSNLKPLLNLDLNQTSNTTEIVINIPHDDYDESSESEESDDSIDEPVT